MLDPNNPTVWFSLARDPTQLTDMVSLEKNAKVVLQLYSIVEIPANEIGIFENTSHEQCLIYFFCLNN